MFIIASFGRNSNGILDKNPDAIFVVLPIENFWDEGTIVTVV